MAASLHQLRSKATQLRAEDAARLRQLVLQFEGLPQDSVRAILLTIDRKTAADRGWTFVMLSPAQNAAVVRWLRRNSNRAGMAVQLWAELLTGLRIDTGEVMLTREELAERVEARTTAVSEVLGELERIGAISRRREPIEGTRGPGRLAIFINPNVATRLTGLGREKAQAATKPVETAG